MPVPPSDTASNPQQETTGARRAGDSTFYKSKDHRPEHVHGKHREGRHQQRRPSIVSLLDEVRTFSEQEHRLEYETHRAEEAISRAEYAETRLKDAFDQLMEAEEARSQAEIHSIKVEEDLHRHKEQLKRVESECANARTQIEQLQQAKSISEKEVEKAMAANFELQSQFRSYQAKEEGRGEGLKNGILRQFNENRQYVWEAGFSDGFEEGKEAGLKEGLRKGRKEGVREGIKQGRREERKNAIEAFDRFIREKCEGEDEEQTRTRWTESVYYTERD
ncbi:hypothetical protein FB446DRAFT_76310 [Lentinula raphanica]|nr:hypothetical protein FB446DRAFT_76310 [Lentinula raphanica]